MATTPAEAVGRQHVTLLEPADTKEKYCPQCSTRHPQNFDMCPHDGTRLVDADELVGTTLSNSYVVTRILGEGGMGRVYEAKHTRLGSKRFAIKTLHEDLAHLPEVTARFRREAEVAAAIDSPYVVSVYDVDETYDGRLFLVSELLEGVELGAYLAQYKKLAVPLAVRIARHICKALAAAHRVGAVHRDLKPENIFLTGDATAPMAKVLDFGIAKFDDQTGKALTKTGMVMGTPAYMSPEQANGQKVDHRADIYGVGAILYVALTGRAPFEGEDPGGVLIQVMTREPPRPRSIESSIPAALELVVQRAMAPERDQRYGLVQELDAALAPFDVGEAEAASFEFTPYSQSSAATLRVGEHAQRLEAVRRELDLLWLAGLGWLGLGLWSALAAVVRLGRGGTLTGPQTLAVAFGCVIALGVPTFLLRKYARPSDDAARALLDKLRAPLFAAVAVYGLCTLLLRFSTLVLMRSSGSAWPGWDVILWLTSLVAAALVALPGFLERRGAANPFTHALERPALSAATAMLVLTSLFVIVPVVRSKEPPPAVRAVHEVRALEAAVAKGDLDVAADHLERLADMDAASSPDVQNVAVELAEKSVAKDAAVADRVFELLSEEMGSAGLDVLYRLHTGKGESAERANKLLADEEVRAHASPALRVAYELAQAKNCDEVVKLIDRAEREGDTRALDELNEVASCAHPDRCCLKGDARVMTAIASMRKRLQ
jgi:serine/threonine-protein kinase